MFFNHDILDRKTVIPPTSSGTGNDIYVWGGTTTGLFSIASAYNELIKKEEDNTDVDWKEIWKIQVSKDLKLNMASSSQWSENRTFFSSKVHLDL
ncbi:unnamed protein product [Vicia faba]|uniref:Uncharacterized protein n=1 Tax=Vicia faba TaxID=3906 RepID=A0AAV0ZQY4_VICFA|nr:unnamed protein product [Vicia faba]